ncbi:MAG: hypothetical protein JXB38_14965 [Anaerolineales bacterium]|nr:hypothetical protein [Anaerolineales bacterium]
MKKPQKEQAMYPNPLITLSAYTMKVAAELKVLEKPGREPYPTTKWWVEQKTNYTVRKGNHNKCS